MQQLTFSCRPLSSPVVVTPVMNFLLFPFSYGEAEFIESHAVTSSSEGASSAGAASPPHAGNRRRVCLEAAFPPAAARCSTKDRPLPYVILQLKKGGRNVWRDFCATILWTKVIVFKSKFPKLENKTKKFSFENIFFLCFPNLFFMFETRIFSVVSHLAFSPSLLSKNHTGT